MTSFFSIVPLLLVSYRSIRGSPAVWVADRFSSVLPPLLKTPVSSATTPFTLNTTSSPAAPSTRNRSPVSYPYLPSRVELAFASTAVHLGRDPGAVGRGGPVDGVRVPFDGSEIVFKPRRARPESATGSSLGSVVPRSCKEQNTLWLRAPLSKNSAKNTPEEGHARDKRGMTWALTR